jgi:O-succinylbenzoic acid--CoA ligase
VPLVVVRLPPPEAADAIRRAWDMGRGVLVLDPRAPQAEIDRVTSRLDPDGEVAPDVAAVVVTSGTTGEPKGVELTFGGLQSSGRAVSDALGVGPGSGDRWLCCLPLHHVGGLAVLARSWTVGTPVDVLLRFDVEAVRAAAGAAGTGATLLSLVPVMARRLLAAGVDLGRFRRVLIGGGPVAADLPGTATYGLTETWGGVVHAGHPLDGVEVALGHDDEILVRGLAVMRGYRSPTGVADTAAAFTRDGWLRTGDAGAFDGEGRLRVVDRLRDLVKTGGVSVSPTEVEAVLAAHPKVADVCVSGAPDPEWGERVVAYVVPADPTAPPPTLDDLRSFARDRLSAAKLPREAIMVDAIPRTPGGKPLRRLLTSTPRPPGSS